ncbi:Phospholipid scramblase 2 [Araneus ventricosus]|uniref:Phospholipid scramblase n=1 Tax=Araneus ventricosus TaxID=182803 RepID=A0A4Y2SVT8_ARAVE|nr:Phospholipid scramblase 2 [Araneus ventricosus]
MSYPPSSPSAPPPGINPAILSGGEPPYPSGPGYPPGSYPPTGGSTGAYPATGGYPQPVDTYPPTGGYPQPMDTYPPTGGYPQPGIPMTHQPQPGAGYPPPGAMQPGADWMPIPTGVPVCPRGLEYLTMIDQLLVHQKVELLEAFLSFETKNKYTIKNSMGQKIYTAKEETKYPIYVSFLYIVACLREAIRSARLVHNVLTCVSYSDSATKHVENLAVWCSHADW